LFFSPQNPPNSQKSPEKVEKNLLPSKAYPEGTGRAGPPGRDANEFFLPLLKFSPKAGAKKIPQKAGFSAVGFGKIKITIYKQQK
jgi:hypothetical protein